MAVTMICPNLKCGRTVVAPDSARGRIVRCAHCQHLFMVPANVVVKNEKQQNNDANNAGKQRSKQ